MKNGVPPSQVTVSLLSTNCPNGRSVCTGESQEVGLKNPGGCLIGLRKCLVGDFFLSRLSLQNETALHSSFPDVRFTGSGSLRGEKSTLLQPVNGLQNTLWSQDRLNMRNSPSCHVS